MVDTVYLILLAMISAATLLLEMQFILHQRFNFLCAFESGPILMEKGGGGNNHQHVTMEYGALGKMKDMEEDTNTWISVCNFLKHETLQCKKK